MAPWRAWRGRRWFLCSLQPEAAPVRSCRPARSRAIWSRIDELA